MLVPFFVRLVAVGEMELEAGSTHGGMTSLDAGKGAFGSSGLHEKRPDDKPNNGKREEKNDHQWLSD